MFLEYMSLFGGTKSDALFAKGGLTMKYLRTTGFACAFLILKIIFYIIKGIIHPVLDVILFNGE